MSSGNWVELSSHPRWLTKGRECTGDEKTAWAFADFPNSADGVCAWIPRLKLARIQSELEELLAPFGVLICVTAVVAAYGKVGVWGSVQQFPGFVKHELSVRTNVQRCGCCFDCLNVAIGDPLPQQGAGVTEGKDGVATSVRSSAGSDIDGALVV